jgi:NCS2 family nucleobase:cation symporter-2
MASHARSDRLEQRPEAGEADSSPARGLTLEQRRDPAYVPPLPMAIALGVQHVLAMFVSNITPPIIVAGAAGFGFGSADPSALIYMIQAAMLFAGVATLLQTVGLGPIGARLPLVQGTSFAFISVMIPIVAGKGVEGMAALTTAAFLAGLLHAGLSRLVGPIRFALPPLVTGLVVLMIGLSLVRVGIEYAAGGRAARASGLWFARKLGFGGRGRGDNAGAQVLRARGVFDGGGPAGAARRLWRGLGHGQGRFRAGGAGALGDAAAFPRLWLGAVAFGHCRLLPDRVRFLDRSIGDVEAICENGAGRRASDREVMGAVAADGVGTALSALFGAMPNTTFSQNVGLIAMSGLMSRFVVTLGALFLIVCGLLPKIGAVITTVPIEVLGGGVIVMFGMVASSAIAMLSGVVWNQRNMLIGGTALSLALGLQLEPEALGHLPETARILLSSGVMPVAVIAVVLNLILPQEI